MGRPELTSVRVDAWTWAIRLYPTRSAASAACRAGHVKVNGRNAKASHAVRPGDTVVAQTPGGERVVVVTGLIDKRSSAAVAADHYEDRTPPPPPKESRPAVVTRERGSGRPTKRDRRLVDACAAVAEHRPTLRGTLGALSEGSSAVYVGIGVFRSPASASSRSTRWAR